MTKKNLLKEEILDSIDGNLIKDNSKEIKASYYALMESKKAKHAKVNWGVLGTSVGILAASAVIIPFAIKAANSGKTNNTSVIDLVPQTVSAQVPDISFGVASLSGVLSSNQGINTPTKSARSMDQGGPGPGGPSEGDPHGYPEEENDDYLVPVTEMYKLVKPYLTTVDDMLNGGEFVYQIEESGNETYPYKLGNFIFNVVEDKEEEGEVSEEPEEEEQNEEIQPLESFKDEPTEGEPTEGEPNEGEPIPTPNFTFINEFYTIEGILTVNDVEFNVTGEQITFGCSVENASAQYSELYLNVILDEETELTVYKSTYCDSFTNTFRDTTVELDYVEESYAYITNKLEKFTDKQGNERIKRNVINSIQINTAKEKVTIEEETRENAKVYLSLKSSYLDEEEVENTITADLSFRLPRNDDHKYDIQEVEEIVLGDTTEEPTEEVKTKAMRVDYDCRVVNNTPFENDEEFGHGQHHDGEMPGPRRHPGEKFNEYTCVSGTFFIYKDSEGSLLDPDFENEGRHQVSGNGGYNHDWYDNWNW